MSAIAWYPLDSAPAPSKPAKSSGRQWREFFGRIPVSSQSEAFPSVTEETVTVRRLSSLLEPALEVASPFVVVIEQTSAVDNVATIREACISASGSSPDEAFEALQMTVAYLFRRLRAMPDEQLGKVAQRQKKLLRRHVVEYVDAEAI